MEIITAELGGRTWPEPRLSIIKRCIHTSADFDYADNLVFSENAENIGVNAIRGGAHIITDTKMAFSGINKNILASFGGDVHCFISDPDVIDEAKKRGETRASVSMEKAAKLKGELIFALGNAPTALYALCRLVKEGKVRPALIIGVPVGFVNVVESKEAVMGLGIPYIVAKGRKGGSNIAATICNAMMYHKGDVPQGAPSPAPAPASGKGKLYGIGIGPGDPGLMTLRSKQILDRVRHIIAPVKKEGEDGTALKIISRNIDIDRKQVHKLIFPMEGGREQFEEYGRAAGDSVIKILERGEDVAMITLGDVSVYSTYMYLNGYVAGRGFETEVIPGITSFTNAAALAKMPLMLGEEGLVVMPAAKTGALNEILDMFENVVIMKAGKAMRKIADVMDARGIPQENAVVVSRAGMDGEYIGPIDTGRDFNYFTTVLLKR
jgi:precorrin-8X/cobalt-precorrin-8 methylmutase